MDLGCKCTILAGVFGQARRLDRRAQQRSCGQTVAIGARQALVQGWVALTTQFVQDSSDLNRSSPVRRAVGLHTPRSCGHSCCGSACTSPGYTGEDVLPRILVPGDPSGIASISPAADAVRDHSTLVAARSPTARKYRTPSTAVTQQHAHGGPERSRSQEQTCMLRQRVLHTLRDLGVYCRPCTALVD